MVLVKRDNGWQLAPKPSEEELRRLRGGYDEHGRKLAPSGQPAAAASK